jgi:DNA-directed RNA polymerases I and III subunit RPAC2
MNIRIQTYGNPIEIPKGKRHRLSNRTTDGTTATEALAKGLQDLEDLCDVVADKFWTARNTFVEVQGKMVS